MSTASSNEQYAYHDRQVTMVAGRQGTLLHTSRAEGIHEWVLPRVLVRRG